MQYDTIAEKSNKSFMAMESCS